MATKNDLLNEFSAFIEKNDALLDQCNASLPPGLYDLFVLMAEVKNETKRSAKQMQQVQAVYDQTIGMLETQINTQENSQAQLKQYLDLEHERQAKLSVLNIVSYRDRLLRNFEVAQMLQTQLRQTYFNKESKRLVNNLITGLEMALMQVDQDLKTYGVKKTEAIGEVFDPKYMKIHALEKHENKENMVVLSELIAGYRDQSGKLIRYAEVIVNKL
ncbi:nucleotide exchange factor GrpE [Cysteiniphilum sp. 6C5]|uniref:nucleotide exchange factor GrpE n=1 Tax=unclassified Cysteiniphilum TaxID=2610889 RepID=UPI003F83E838